MLRQGPLIVFQLHTEGHDGGREPACLGACDGAGSTVALPGPPAWTVATWAAVSGSVHRLPDRGSAAVRRSARCAHPCVGYTSSAGLPGGSAVLLEALQPWADELSRRRSQPRNSI